MRRFLRVLALAGAASGAAGCVTTKVLQRDGCWVRQTHKTLHGTQEELGPCVRAPPRWSEDRLTRIIQECVAQADYRWQVRALAAWSRREPLPAEAAQETVISTCMNEAATADVVQNETLRQRLAELAGDRDALRGENARGNELLRASNDRLVGYLGEAVGEAAKRPPPTATATATASSDGRATSDTGLQSDTGISADTATSAPAPAGTVTAAAPRSAGAPIATATSTPTEGSTSPAKSPGASAVEERVAKRLAAARAARRARAARTARATGCDLPAPEGAVGTEAAASPPPAASAGRAP
jgi:hypothetical protein